jgi:hypothetical protein
VKITLADGVERTLRYTLRAMREAAEEFGGSITSAETLKKLDENTLGKLIWYGLRADQPDLTVEQVEELIDPTMLRYCLGQYTLALGASAPEPPKNDQSEQPTTQTPESTGSHSGASEPQPAGSASLTTASGV